jgi:F0F1-type ATP synthase assembly protein I
VNQKEKNKRIDIASWTAIIVGLIIGILLRKARWGFIIGLLIGIVLVYLWSRQKQKMKQ